MPLYMTVSLFSYTHTSSSAAAGRSGAMTTGTGSTPSSLLYTLSASHSACMAWPSSSSCKRARPAWPWILSCSSTACTPTDQCTCLGDPLCRIHFYSVSPILGPKARQHGGLPFLTRCADCDDPAHAQGPVRLHCIHHRRHSRVCWLYYTSQSLTWLQLWNGTARHCVSSVCILIDDGGTSVPAVRR